MLLVGERFGNGRGRRGDGRMNRKVPRLTLFTRDNFVTREKRILWVAFSRKTDRIGGFGAREGDGAQQKLGEMAEGGGFLAGDAPLGEEAEDLSESAVHAGGGREIGAGGIEFGKVESRSDHVASGRGAAEQLLFSFGVKGTHGGMNVGAGHGALASIGKGEPAAGRQGFRDPSLAMEFVHRDTGREIAGDDAGGIVTRGWRDAVAVGCFLYGSHRQVIARVNGEVNMDTMWTTGRAVENRSGHGKRRR